MYGGIQVGKDRMNSWSGRLKRIQYQDAQNSLLYMLFINEKRCRVFVVPEFEDSPMIGRISFPFHNDLPPAGRNGVTQSSVLGFRPPLSLLFAKSRLLALFLFLMNPAAL